MCRRRAYFSIPEQNGSWFENRTGSRITTVRGLDSLDLGAGRIHVPSHWALQHDKDAIQSSSSDSSAALELCTDDGFPGIDFLSTLPAEILVEILKIIVPSQRIFHFTPVARKRTSRMSVHQLCRLGRSPNIKDLPNLASVCRRMRSITYDLFYGAAGQNQFVLEVSNVPLTAAINVHPDLNYRAGKAPSLHRIGTWSKVCQASSNEEESLFPFSSTTLRCVADLTLAVSMSSLPTYRPAERRSKRKSARPVFYQVSQDLEAFAACFVKTGHSLRTLSLTLGVTKRNGGHFISQDLRLCNTFDRFRYHPPSPEQVPPPRLEFNDRTVFDPNQVSVRSNFYGEVYHPTAEPVQHISQELNVLIDEMLAPLLRVRGLRGVKVGGLVGENFTKEFERVAVGPFEETEEDEQVSCEPPKKRRRRG